MERHAGIAWRLGFGIGFPVLGILIVLFVMGTVAALLVSALALLLTTAGLTLVDDSSGFWQGPAHCVQDTAGGRQQNRRVELVVSGEVIGTTIGELPMQPTTLPQPR